LVGCELTHLQLYWNLFNP